MSTTPDVQEAVERAEQVQRDRLDAVRDLAAAAHEAEQIAERHATERADMERRQRDEMKGAENAHVSAHSAALKLGWSAAELKRIGFSEPAKKRRVQRRRSESKGRTKPTTERASEATTDAGATDDTGGTTEQDQPQHHDTDNG